MHILIALLCKPILKERIAMKNLLLLCLCLFLCGCTVAEPPPDDAPSASPTAVILPDMPSGVELAKDGSPMLNVYVVVSDELHRMPVEEYLEGVVAGEMQNDWPIEALRAQAILARTFVMRFIGEKDSVYPGADISTDISEAQAYNASAVNAQVRRAVQSTAGMVLSTESGGLPYAWFHAHSGGTTATAKEGLAWNDAEPAWTKNVSGLDSSAAPDEAREWSATFPAAEFLSACRSIGVYPESADDVFISRKGNSGRAVTLTVAGEEVNAANLRIALGSTKMRSTLLTDLRAEDGEVIMAGLGYGHGVGMPQWGAYALAEDGLTGEEIAVYYFDGLHVAKMW